MRIFLVLATALVLYAQAPVAPVSWDNATELPGIDFSGLSAAQKIAALKMMRGFGCTCGCDMKVAQCRIEDPACTYSKGIAGLMIAGFKEGKKPEEILKSVSESAVGRTREPQKILEDPVKIPITGAPSLGPDSARVVLVEFSDFECPYCAKAAVEVHEIAAAYPKDVRIVYKQFPLSMHTHANMAAMASIAAQEQGKFWPMHDKMFANFRQLNRENVFAWAQQLGLDMEKFKAAMDSPKNKALLQKDMQDGDSAGVNGTPSLYVNGKHFNGLIALAALKPILDEELKTTHAGGRP